MVKFFDMFTKFMLIGLVTVSIFAFGISFQDENNASEPFIESTVMNETFSDLRTGLADSRDLSQTQKSLFEREDPTPGFGIILLFSIVSSGKVFNAMIIGVFNTLIRLPVVFLGLDPVIVTVLSTMLIISIILGLWIVYKLGG